jgi:predicted transcriptional regulator
MHVRSRPHTESVDLSVALSVDYLGVSTTIRVSEQTRDRFARLADATGRPMTQLLDDAADDLERRLFFDQFSARYEALRADDAAWGEIEVERAVEGGAVRDLSS